MKNILQKIELGLFWIITSTTIVTGILYFINKFEITKITLFPQHKVGTLGTIETFLLIGTLFTIWWAFFVLPKTRIHLSSQKGRWFWPISSMIGILFALFIASQFSIFWYIKISEHIPMFNTRLSEMSGMSEKMIENKIIFTISSIGAGMIIFTGIIGIILIRGYQYYTRTKCNPLFLGDYQSLEMKNRIIRQRNVHIAPTILIGLVVLLSLMSIFSLFELIFKIEILNESMTWYKQGLMFLIIMITIGVLFGIRLFLYLSSQGPSTIQKNNIQKSINIIATIIDILYAIGLFAFTYLLFPVFIMYLFLFWRFVLLKIMEESILNMLETKTHITIEDIQDLIPKTQGNNAIQENLWNNLNTIIEIYIQEEENGVSNNLKRRKNLYLDIEHFENENRKKLDKSLKKTIQKIKTVCIIGQEREIEYLLS